MSTNVSRSSESALSPVIDTVQQRGDLLDRVSWLRRAEHVGAVATIGAGAAGIHLGDRLDAMVLADQAPGPVFLASGVLFAAGLAASYATHPISRRYHAKKGAPLREALDTLSNQFNGDSVEIYHEHHFRKEKRVHLVWEPREDNADDYDRTVSALTTLDTQIKDAAINTVVIPNGVLQGRVKSLPPYKYVDRASWLEDVKHTYITDVAKRDNWLLIFTREDFALLVERLNTKDQPQPLDIYMQLLRQQRAKHPSLRFYNEQSAAGPAKNRQRLIKSLATSLNARLTDTDTMTAPNDKGAPTSKEKVHKTGRVFLAGKHTATIRWNLDNGRPSGDTDSLLRYVGITEKELEDLPKRIKHMPKAKAILACEIGAYLAAHNALRNPPNGDALEKQGQLANRTSTENTASARGMQVRIADRALLRKPPEDAREKTGISLKNLRSCRMAKSLIVLTLAGGLGGAISIGNEAYQGYYFDKNISPIYDKVIDIDKQPGISPEKAQQLQDEAYEEVDQATKDATPLFRIAGAITKGSYNFQELISSRIQKLSTLQELAPEEASKAAEELFDELNRSLVGNTSPSKNKPLWFIQSFGGMNSEGYWTEATSHYISNGEIEWLHYQPTNSYLEKAKVTTLPSPSNSDITKPHLVLSRMMSARPEKNGSLIGLDYFKEYTIFNVPVLENTEITAAIAGKNIPLKAVRLKNGQQVLLAPREFKTGKIEYWLSPSKSPDQPVHAIKPLEDPYPYNWKDSSIKPVTTPWKQVLPSSLSLHGLARVKAQADYITDNFDYRTRPFKTAVPEKFDAYAAAVLKSEQANCNTANTLLAISNPQTLSAVTGYRNTNTPEQVAANSMHLSSNEGHLWTVDKQGNFHDATPHKGLTPEDAALFKEDYQESFTDPVEKRKKKVATLLTILIAGGITGAGYKSRRRIKREIDRNLDRYAAKQFITTPEERKQLTYAVAEHVLYSDKPLTSKELETIKQRLADPSPFEEITSAHQLWSDIQGGRTPKQFKKVISADTNPARDHKELRKVIKQTKQINRWAYRLNRTGQASHPDQLQSRKISNRIRRLLSANSRVLAPTPKNPSLWGSAAQSQPQIQPSDSRVNQIIKQVLKTAKTRPRNGN